MATAIRLIRRSDAIELAELLSENREHFESWVPARRDDYFTATGQHAEITAALGARRRGGVWPGVIIDGRQIIGRIALTGIQHNGLSSATLGYSVAGAAAGRGHATAAVARMCDLAFGDLGLHRIDAGTVVTNLASQRVLVRNGFLRLCTAPRYVFVTGQWRDAALFQKLNEN